MKKLSPVTLAALILGTAAIIYYIVCGCARSFTVSGLWIWLGFGLIMHFGCACRLLLEPRMRGKAVSVYKKLKTVCFAAFVLFMAVFAVFECLLIGTWISGYGNLDTPADAVVILGATVEGDRPGDALRRRIDTAYEYVSSHPDITVIACGGLGEDDTITEADCIKAELVSRGIPEKTVLTEARSTSTYENFLFAAELIPSDAKRIAVVTSGFHQFRAGIVGNVCLNDDVSVIPVSATDVSLFLPNSMVREFAGFVSDVLDGNIAP